MIRCWAWAVIRRQPQYAVLSVGFFVLVLSLFPMLVDDPSRLQAFDANAVTWLAVALLSLLSAQMIFTADYDSGFLEQLTLSRSSMLRYVWRQVFVHWIGTMLPIVMVIPLGVFIYHLDFIASLWLMLSVLCASPCLVLMNAWVSALLLGSKQPHMLALLLIIPLLVPVLLFGSGVVIAWYQHRSLWDGFLLLLSLCLIAIGCLPYAITMALKIAITMRKSL